MKINKKIRLMLKASECLFMLLRLKWIEKNERIARHFAEDFCKLNYYLIKITSIAFNDDGGTDNDEGASCVHNYCEFFCISMLEKLIYSISIVPRKILWRSSSRFIQKTIYQLFKDNFSSISHHNVVMVLNYKLSRPKKLHLNSTSFKFKFLDTKLSPTATNWIF